MSNKKYTAAGAAPKPKPKATAKGPVMYVGPTIPGIGIQNQVFTEIPASAQEVFKKEPELGYIHSAFNKALELKNGGKK